eukprot:COSAG02_NODE_695_length_18407_cov_105.138573_11_plen_69_part_00
MVIMHRLERPAGGEHAACGCMARAKRARRRAARRDATDAGRTESKGRDSLHRLQCSASCVLQFAKWAP